MEAVLHNEDLTANQAQSLDEWRQIAGNRFVPLHVTAPNASTFKATMRCRVIEGITISEIVADAHSVHREPRLISPADANHVKLTLLVEGKGEVSQDGRSTQFHAGDIVLHDTARPYTLDFTGAVSCLVLAFPQHVFEVPSRLIQRITARRLPGDDGIGSIISPFIQHMAANLDLLQGVNGERILRSALDLLTTLAYSEIVSTERSAEQMRLEELHAVKLYIEDHLDDPELGARKVAHEHHVSVRYLQYMFHNEGTTVSSFIRSRRLAHCRRDLLDPAQSTLSVSHIGQRWGFLDASHFSKVFKAEFGVSPRSFRERQSSSVRQLT
ncbi:helix-turn-helix domain-containing protein [Citricoccus sp. GCM10030269]|uniref:AraC-like ligand-binding domain-containing protein n=1 Tax=Citricoccus sp. GCM10030269 TaxID=3273388 RepID=UPI003618F9A7